ncbi:adenylate/guanylate cyclase domain-containing protein [Chondrinema litorale]|uniref:adenylate/guanylate cyclase domain-containing protein n=1 Tax=Chondrinema litorale TaxID=2994555 RepID=UPI0025434341|nr:adenylate/guanylate cyclase domain-containing protein [Chondrinema litorale]UZR99182.1 adenylate/guanylate cyclase domain-containing protein [Chondrinema litorale]
MIRPKTKRDLNRIIPFGVIWLLSGWIFLIVELAATDSFNQLPTTAIQMDTQIFIMSSLAITCVGLFIGFIEIKYLENVFANKKFIVKICSKFFIYTLVFFFVVLITFPIAASLEIKAGLFDPRVWDKYLEYFTSITHLSTVLQLTASLIVSLFYSEISEYIGQGVLMKFFTGKYHSPIEEERIFMFLDMKSSTSIAEKLGHVEYFKLLKSYYADIAEPIIDFEGEIYQYVGDEIIVSWKLASPKLNTRCIDCFFAMRDALLQKSDWYKATFGIVPTFKAGIHLGNVTAGEIGVIKKEILFTGDVLNATARIQGLCNSLNTDLLLSSDLAEILNPDNKLQLKVLGEFNLRGKEESKELYTVG